MKSNTFNRILSEFAYLIFYVLGFSLSYSMFRILEVPSFGEFNATIQITGFVFGGYIGVGLSHLIFTTLLEKNTPNFMKKLIFGLSIIIIIGSIVLILMEN